MLEGPRSEYARRLDARQRDQRQWEAHQRLLSHARLGTFVAGLAFAWVALAWEVLATWTIGMPLLAFLWLVLRHDVASRAARRATRAVEYYRRGLARIDYDLKDAAKPGDDFRDPGHAYADHLDLFGTGSLFARLCGAQTRSGEATLAGWLLEPASAEEIRSRHAAIDELRSRLDLREDLAVLGPEVREGLHPEALAAWGEAPPHLMGGTRRGGTRRRAIALALASALVLCRHEN